MQVMQTKQHFGERKRATMRFAGVVGLLYREDGMDLHDNGRSRE